MPRILAALLIGVPLLGLLAGCGGDASASTPPPPLSAVQALDYCDTQATRPLKIQCFERVARGEDPSRIALR